MGVEVTGIDASDQLIAAARQRSDGAIAYRVADARELSFLPADCFDACACLLAIQNIHPVQPVFDGVARVLKPWGRFVIVMMHPAFRGLKETSWGWDDAKKVQFRRVDRYLTPRKTPIVTHPGKDPDQYTWTFHKNNTQLNQVEYKKKKKKAYMPNSRVPSLSPCRWRRIANIRS